MTNAQSTIIGTTATLCAIAMIGSVVVVAIVAVDTVHATRVELRRANDAFASTLVVRDAAQSELAECQKQVNQATNPRGTEW